MTASMCRLAMCWAIVAAAAALGAQDVVRIGAKNFTESAVLAELMAQTIEEHTDLVVERRANLGGTMICWTALQSGKIDLYAEYTGTGWATILGRTERLADPLAAYFEVRRQCREQHDVDWLEPFGFNNTYALAMPEQKAAELEITRISDLRPHQGNLRVAFGPEFGQRRDGYLGLAEAYNLDFANMRSVDHGLVYEAVAAGSVDLMDAYSTDGKLLRYELRVLADDRQFFPPYNAAPMVRGAALRQHPEIESALARLAFQVSDREAQALNYAVEAEAQTPAQAARAFLEAKGLVDGALPDAAEARRVLDRFLLAPPTAGASVRQRPGFFALLAGDWQRVLQLLLVHVGLTLLAVILATAVAVPLGIWIVVRAKLQSAVLGVAGVVQTIPSLALLAFMIPVLGLGVASAVVALFLYALLPILRNTCTGIAGVEPDLVDAARGMGLRPREVLQRVQLPLAMPTIMAGVRTATVISIGVATLAAFIGAGGLGQPIVEGLTLNDSGLILLGAVPAAILALLADLVLGKLQQRLRSPGQA